MWKEELREYSCGSLKVSLVDGEYVRKNLYIDFTLGGHDKVHDFIPANEVWLESDIKPSELRFIFLHELAERNRMIKGLPYEEAHKAANELERRARYNEELTESLICEQYGGMNMPCCGEKREGSMPKYDLRTEKELADKRAMEEASRLKRPALVTLEGEKTLSSLLPMSPEEGPPFPRALGLKWPWKK